MDRLNPKGVTQSGGGWRWNSRNQERNRWVGQGVALPSPIARGNLRIPDELAEGFGVGKIETGPATSTGGRSNNQEAKRYETTAAPMTVHFSSIAQQRSFPNTCLRRTAR